MKQQITLRERMEALAGHPRPVLSVYLSVNPALPENRARAYLLRLKDALKQMGLPSEFEGRIYRFVESERPDCRTLVIFADPDGLWEASRLRVDLPDAFGWGEPYVAPLMLIIEEHEPFGVALVDARRLRFLVGSLEGIEETLNESNPLDTAGWREVTSSPSTANPGGGKLTDGFTDRVDAHLRRFYKEAGESLLRVASEEGIERLILAGPPDRTAEFRRALPHDLRKRVVGEARIPAEASEGVILERLDDVSRRIERGRAAELLARARERGVRGFEETLTALQEENRVYHLLVPWEFEGEVRWCDNEGLAIRDVAQKDCPYCGRQTRSRRVLNVLIDLASTRGSRIEFLRGESATTLRDEFEGIAGLTRF